MEVAQYSEVRVTVLPDTEVAENICEEGCKSRAEVGDVVDDSNKQSCHEPRNEDANDEDTSTVLSESKETPVVQAGSPVASAVQEAPSHVSTANSEDCPEDHLDSTTCTSPKTVAKEDNKQGGEEPDAVEVAVVHISTPTATVVQLAPQPAPGRTCAHCRTQKTPLWRNGPLGPKTLCNACGVRFKLGKLQPTASGLMTPIVSNLPSNTMPSSRKRSPISTPGLPSIPSKRPKHILQKPHSRPIRAAATTRAKFMEKEFYPCTTKPATLLTEYDGAVLLMVLAGLYSN